MHGHVIKLNFVYVAFKSMSVRLTNSMLSFAERTPTQHNKPREPVER